MHRHIGTIQKNHRGKVIFSESKSSDVSHSLRHFDFLCLLLQTLISAFYIFLQLFLLAASLYFAAVLKDCIEAEGIFFSIFLSLYFVPC